MKRTLISLSLISVFAVTAISMPAYIGVLKGKYEPKKDGKVAGAKCGVCHVGMSKKLNPYGADLAKLGKVTPDTLAKVDGLDSDGDGVKNGAEFKADTLPGDKASK